jgi:hypothetical protein
VLVDRGIEQVFPRTLELVFAAQRLEQSGRGPKVGNWANVSMDTERAGGRRRKNGLPAETEIPAPATTTIFFFFRRTVKRRSSCSSLRGPSSWRSRYSVVRGFGGWVRRRLGGEGPSVRTRTSDGASGSLIGDELPDWVVVLGEG